MTGFTRSLALASSLALMVFAQFKMAQCKARIWVHLEEPGVFGQPLLWEFLGFGTLAFALFLLTRPPEVDDYAFPERPPARRILLSVMASALLSFGSYVALDVKALETATAWSVIVFNIALAVVALVRILFWIPHGSNVALADVKHDAEAMRRGEAL